MTGVHYDIMVELQKLVVDRVADGVMPGLDPQDVRVRLVPRADEELDVVPCVVIAPTGDATSAPVSFEDDFADTYDVELIIIASNQLDLTTLTQRYGAWQAALESVAKGVVKRCLPAVPSVYMAEILPNTVLDRAKLSGLYTYQSTPMRFYSQEYEE